MVKRVIVPFDFHSMSKHILHILSFLIILSITLSSCYLNPQRESDSSEAGLKGKVKYVKLNESYTEEYNNRLRKYFHLSEKGKEYLNLFRKDIVNIKEILNFIENA